MFNTFTGKKSWLLFSRSGLLVVCTFIILMLAFRLTLPFGDEPDFTVRAVELAEDHFQFWIPYTWFSEWLDKINVNNSCLIEAGPLSLTASIDSRSCSEDIYQSLGRYFLTLIILSPILILVVWRGLGVALLNHAISSTKFDINQRYDALSLSLLVPGMIYYLGLLSHEQLTLTISIYIFLFWRNWLLVYFVLAIVGSIDLGNAIMVAFFILFNHATQWLVSNFGFKLTIGILFIIILAAYRIGFEGLSYLSYISFLEQKSEAIIDKALQGDFLSKYPILLRPVITYMTTIFMTPAGVKVVPLYIGYGIAIFILAIRIVKCNITQHQNIGCNQGAREYIIKQQWMIAGLSAVAMVLFSVIMLPDYNNAKYYIFLLPFILKLATQTFSFRSIYIFNTLFSSLIPLTMIIYKY